MQRFALRRPKGIIALAGIAALLVVFIGAQAPALKPSEIDQVTAQLVVRTLERDHIAKPTINDDVAKVWAKNFIEDLDPSKYYFLKADVDEFMADASKLDDQVLEGDLTWSKKVFDRFLERSDERLADATEILKTKPDFTKDETIVDDPDLLDYPATAEEARDRLRRMIKYELLRRKNSTLDKDEDPVDRLGIIYRDLNRRYKLFNSTDRLELFLTSLTRAIDPQSNYWQATTVEDFFGQTLHLSLEGIGAQLSVEDGYPIVMEIVPGGAADKDGRLKPEDKIVGVEGEQGEKEEFIGKKLSDVVRKIRGPRGTKVRLIVQPADSKELKVYELTREKIELKDQHAQGKVIESKTENGEVLKIGVINLPTFYGDPVAVLSGDVNAVSATRDCRKLLEGFKKQGVDAVIMDLRANGGGLLPEGISLSGLFIDKGPVVQVRGPGGVLTYEDDDEGVAWDGPLAVVVSHFSASASEIFAGVIKDYKRGLIIGDSSTYGKGTVQQIIMLNDILEKEFNLPGKRFPNLGAVKLTIQQFYRANGDSTQIRGVKPDVHIPSILDQRTDIGEKSQDNALKFDQVPPVPHDLYNRVNSDLATKLQERSVQRRKEDPKFQKEQKAIQRYLERKERHEISLNEKKYKEETTLSNEEEKEKEELENKTTKGHTERDPWESGYYNDEVVAIVRDYITLGQDILTAGPVHPNQGGRERPALRP